jgi:predicted NAD/FAD-binding protein
VQLIVDEAVGGQARLTVDDGGGVHGHSGARVGAIRRAPSGEWVIDGQNTDAARADAEIPAAAEDQARSGKDIEP